METLTYKIVNFLFWSTTTSITYNRVYSTSTATSPCILRRNSVTRHGVEKTDAFPGCVLFMTPNFFYLTRIFRKAHHIINIDNWLIYDASEKSARCYWLTLIGLVKICVTLIGYRTISNRCSLNIRLIEIHEFSLLFKIWIKYSFIIIK